MNMGKKRRKELIQIKGPPRNKIIMVRCSEDHYQMLKEAANANGDKISTWILFAALNFQKPVE